MKSLSCANRLSIGGKFQNQEGMVKRRIVNEILYPQCEYTVLMYQLGDSDKALCYVISAIVFLRPRSQTE